MKNLLHILEIWDVKVFFSTSPISSASVEITGSPQFPHLCDSLFILMTFCFFEFPGFSLTRYLSHPRFIEHSGSLR